MDESPAPVAPALSRPWLLREAAGAPHAEILRSTPVSQPVHVRSQEHRWFRRVDSRWD